MQALLSLSSYVHSIDAPSCFPARLPNRSIAEMILRRFTASLVDALASGREAWGKEQGGRQASFFDMKFLRRLLTLWTSDWDGLSDLDELIKQLEVGSLLNCIYGAGYAFTPTLPQVSTKVRSDNEASVIEQHVLRTQILLAPLLPPVPQKALTHPNKSSTKDTRTESLLLFGIPAVEQTAQPVMDLVKPGPRFGSLLVGSTTVAR
jgi:conserved oligomeric Golgi complex subunit 1